MQQALQSKKIFQENQITHNQPQTSITSGKSINEQSDTNQTLQIINNQLQALPFVRFNQIFELITIKKQYNIAELIKQYACLMIKNEQDQNFFQHFVQNKYIRVLRQLMNTSKLSSQIVKAVFQSLQILLKGVKKQDQFVYLMLSISKEGFIKIKYQFAQQQDTAYYANFLKILARKINQDQKYLAVFLNAQQPDFPLLKNLLQFHNSNDIILHTSAKLTIMQLFSNKNNNKNLQTYILNFPFVIFYPSYTYPALQAFQSMLKQETVNNFNQALFNQQNLRNHLKFMQDFVSAKNQEQFVHMYVNTFFSLIGRKIFIMLQQKNQTHLILKAIFKIFQKQITGEKIRIGFKYMLGKQLNQKMQKYFKTKTYDLDRNYWLLTQCQDSVKEHCKSIFHNNSSKGKISFLKIMNSYIPKSNSYWFYQQVKKISQIIGCKIDVNYPINHEAQNQTSFITSLNYKGKMVPNPIYQNIIKNDKTSQQVIFWYLKIAKQIDISIVIQDIINEMQICTSLCLVKAFYQYVLCKDFFQQEQKQNLTNVFKEATAKLSYYILTEGWRNFLDKSKEASQIFFGQQFNHDICRSIECDILFFLAIRHLFGTPNKICQQVNNQNLENYENGCVNQLQVNCKWVNSSGQNIKAKLEGQYLMLSSKNDQLITKQPLILSDYKFYRNDQDKNGHCITLGLKKSSQNSFTICFEDESMLDYMMRQFKQRRDRHLMIETELKALKFHIN